MTNLRKYKVVDLFAGAGGLSLGFQQTHKFDIKVAFETNRNAQKTYRRNHPHTRLLDDVCKADYSSIITEFGPIDVVIGGPPCQGFSNVNRQKNHAISKNNMLVKQYVRAVLELQPKAFIMENVGMLKSNTHRFYMDKEDIRTVEEYNIPTLETELPLLDEEYVSKEALEITQDEKLINQYLWDEAEYFLLNIVFRQRKNSKKLEEALAKYQKKLLNLVDKLIKIEVGQSEIITLNYKVGKAIDDYYRGLLSAQEVVSILEKPIMIQRMLSKSKEIFDNNILVERYTGDKHIVAHTRSFAVYDYLKQVLGSDKNGYVIDNGVLSAADFGVPQKRMRFVVMGIKKSICSKVELPKGSFKAEAYNTVRDAIGDLSNINPGYNVAEDSGIVIEPVGNEISSLGRKLRDTNILYNHIVTETRETALKRFAAIRQGENFHSLDLTMKEDTYTDASRTQNTIYLRLDYNEPSGTVINVRKSMWIHPEQNRAISIREAARLQSFPDSFVFEGTKDAQYQQVGNAVPPILAKAIAKKLAKLLNKGLAEHGLSKKMINGEKFCEVI